MQAFKDSREKLQATIQSCIESKALIKLLLCLTAAKLSVEVIGAAMEGQPEPPTIAATLTRALSERLDFLGFHSTVERSENAAFLLERLADAERIWFHLVNELFIHYDHNVATIDTYRGVLQAKRTQSVKKNKWGEIDDSGWAEVLAEFAEEKLYGGIFETAWKSMPLELRAHLEKVNALNLLPRFAWVIFETNKPATNTPADKDVVPTKNGIEFEHELRYRIEQNVPEAIVELTPGSGDQGADLIVYLRDLKIVIQAKHYTGNVGNSAVQEAHAAKGFYAAQVAIVVTNSDFTQSARNLAAELNVMLVYDTQITDLLKAVVA